MKCNDFDNSKTLNIVYWKYYALLCFHNISSIQIAVYTIMYMSLVTQIDGLVQDCGKSSALAMELTQCCAKPLISC